jgi:hypothetical protein
MLNEHTCQSRKCVRKIAGVIMLINYLVMIWYSGKLNIDAELIKSVGWLGSFLLGITTVDKFSGVKG